MNKIYISDLMCLGNDPESNIKTFLKQGLHQIELMMDGGYWDDFLNNKVLISKLKSFEADYSLHSPCWDVNLAGENSYLRKAAYNIAQDSIYFAAEVGSSYLVIHPGFRSAGVFDREKAQERVMEALIKLTAIARREGVKIGIENVGYQGSSLYEQEEFFHLLDGFGDEIGYILDTGHAYLDHMDIIKAIKMTGDKLLGIHLHDNDGISDRHLPVGIGGIDWEPIWECIAQTPKNCNLVIEYNYDVSADPREAAETVKKCIRRA